MKIGFGSADITPAVGCNIGSVRPRIMTAVHDPLLAVACVIDDGANTIAMVGVDAGVVMRETVFSARQRIERTTRISGANVMVSASHTHQGGPTLSVYNAVADPAYVRQVSEGIAAAVSRAWEGRREGEVGSGVGHAAGLAFNRRFLMRDGTQATHPGKGHPDIVRPAGPVDDRVKVLAAREPGGAVLGAVINFGCHCTVTEDGNAYSADYVHCLRQHLKRLLGTDVPVVFMLGACGDITQCNAFNPIDEHGHEWADRMGAKLASAAGRAITSVEWSASAPVAAATETVEIPVRQEDHRPRRKLGLGAGSMWEEVFAREKEHIDMLRRDQPRIPCELQGLGIGGLGIVACGAELFTQPSLDIQSLSPFGDTWVVTLANQYIGYVGTADAYWAGGYEVQTSRASFLAVDAAQRIVEGASSVLGRVKLGAAR